MSAPLALPMPEVSTWIRQFSGLGDRHPSMWPALPRMLLLLALIAAIAAGGAWWLWSGQWDGLEQGRAEEEKLRMAFRAKIIQSKNLELLRAQKIRVMAQVAKLERQLPGKAEMDAMLSEINQAGVGRGLQFELFKPGQVQLREHYAELPIDIRLTGTYHALAAFVSDIANLPRIVTLDHISVSKQKDVLGFQATVHTYRYLDPAETQPLIARSPETHLQKGHVR